MKPINALFAIAVALCAPACVKSVPAAQRVAGEAPPGEVWLTPQQVKDAHIEIEPTGDRPVGGLVRAAGRVTFDDLRVGHVFSPVTGRITKILAQPGQRVKKGESLCVIQSPDLGSAVSDMAKAQASLFQAEQDWKRQKDLLEVHAAAQRDYETAQSTYLNARAEMERAERKAKLLRNASLDAVTQEYVLPSPIDGEVIMRGANPGLEVSGQYSGGGAVELFTIGELDRVWVLADVYEMDLARIKKGAEVDVKVLAYPGDTFTGAVEWVSGALDPISHIAKVRCSVPEPGREASTGDVRDRHDLRRSRQEVRRQAHGPPSPRGAARRVRSNRNDSGGPASLRTEGARRRRDERRRLRPHPERRGARREGRGQRRRPAPWNALVGLHAGGPARHVESEGLALLVALGLGACRNRDAPSRASGAEKPIDVASLVAGCDDLAGCDRLCTEKNPNACISSGRMYEFGHGVSHPARLRRRRPAMTCERVHSLLRLRPKCSQLAGEHLEAHLVLQVHAEVGLGPGAVLGRLPVLAHHDERPLQRDENREREIVEDVRIRIERTPREEIDQAPEDGEPDDEEDEGPAPVPLGDFVGEPLPPRQILLDLLDRVRGRVLAQHGVRFAQSLGHLGQDGQCGSLRATPGAP